jgi:nucleoside-diphosphate-sugar epimerase
MASASDARTLVTGGAGYFGSVLAARLRRDAARVRIFDAAAIEAQDGVESQHGDIRDAAAVRRACDGIDVVYHCVAQVPLARDQRLFDSVNRDGTRTLLDAARAAGVRKVVHLSSSAVFGVPAHNPVTNDTPRQPAEGYGRAKLEAERVCERYAAGGGDVTIVRPRTILGPGRLGVFQILFEWARQGSNVPVLGRGDNLYQFVDAEDLADACVRAAARPGPAVFNIGARSFGTMRETLQALCEHAGTGSRVVSVPAAPARVSMQLTSALRLSPLAPYHWIMFGRSFYFDVAPAMAALDWQPQRSNAGTITAAYDWYVANRDGVLRGRGRASPHRAALRQGILRVVGRLL